MSIMKLDEKQVVNRDEMRAKLVGTYAILDDKNETVVYLVVRASGDSHVKFTSIYPSGEVSNGWHYSLLNEGEAILADLKRPSVVKVLDHVPNMYKYIEAEARGGSDD